MKYLILGSGIAGMAAAEAIRGRDEEAEIQMISAEQELCFNRPMLSSHTTANISTGDEGGRPTNESQGVVLTESGEASQEAGEDNNNANVQ